MEFFERAHAAKSESSGKKLSENKKKQLKQMLYGYKVNDNKLIRNSTNIPNDYDDSTSVSGFSDLNLTNSSYEDNEHAKFSFNSNVSNAGDTDCNVNITDAKNFEEKFSSKDSISEINDSSLPPDSCKYSVNYGTSSLSSDNSVIDDDHSLDGQEYKNDIVKEIEDSSCSDSSASLIISAFNSSLSDTSEAFDADGQLADTIRQKLQLMNNVQRCKRKYVDMSDNCSEVKGPVTKERCKYLQAKGDIILPSNESEESDQSSSSNIDFIPSTSYVSITAEDMQTQRFAEVIGDYKYSTVKSISHDTQNVLCAGDTPFIIDDDLSVDVQTEDEVSSLIPEIDDSEEEVLKETALSLNTTDETFDKSNDANTIESDSNNGEESLEPFYENMFEIYYGTKCSIIILKHPCELFIQGKVKIRAIGGTVELFGYILKDETCNVYAPYYNFAQCIRTLENKNTYNGLFGKLTATGLTVAETENIVIGIGEHDGVIILQELKDKAMDFVDNNFKITNLFTKSNRNIEPYFMKASDITNCSIFYTRPWKSFKIHPDWNEAVKFAEYQYCRGIICGGKGAGKSTYLRYQVNKLLSHGPILVVDLDPGQSEFTVAGSVSATVVTAPLFGPSFTHLRKPNISLNIGMINTMDNAKLYAKAVKMLIAHCLNNKAFANMPWIVNTMGMTNDLGLKFITLIILLVQPTFILQYESQSIKHRFETILTPESVKMLYQRFRHDHLFENVSCSEDMDYSITVAQNTEGRAKDSYTLTPRDERYLNFLAYFSQLLHIYQQNTLHGVIPYEVCLKDLCIVTNVNVKKDYITKVINGKVVALCQQARQCDSAPVFTLSDKPLLCHGHGLIRGIDWEKEILYVITPVQSSELGSVNTLLYSDWVPELVGHERELPTGTMVPYRTTTEDKQKQLMSTPRRRFNPLQLIKMSRNT